MPKQRITKEMVVEAAFEIARNDGRSMYWSRILRKRSVALCSRSTVTVEIWMD